MRNMWWIVTTVLLSIAAPAQAADEAVPTLAPDDIVMGKADAPVTIFEYASLTCPHCAEFDTEILPKVKTDWIDAGKAKLVFRDYPLDQLAVKAAQLAHCAPPERFFGFIDELFHTQRNWIMLSDPVQALSRIGRLGGVSQDKFDACLADKQLQDKILNSRLLAQSQYGVNSTPTFFINGTKTVGSTTYADFAKALDVAFAKAPPPPRSELAGPQVVRATSATTNE
jgi:protein-disulfide isomerase